VTTQTLRQQRAADALSKVKKLDGKTPNFKERYRAYVEQLGPAIIMNGLGQALATERSAAGPDPDKVEKQAHKALYDNVQEWLRRDGGVYAGEEDLLEAITQHDEARYLVAQVEVLEWLQWHKKFCRATFPKGKED
jgi:CRISPR-associated protein Cmr5